MPTRLTASDGVLLLDGQPCKLLGANAYSLYPRIVNNQTPNAYVDVFDMLAEAGCKVVRIFGDGFNTAGQLGLWETDSAAALAATQTLFDAAHARGIVLVWCIHWHLIGVATWKGEANSALVSGTTASRTYLKLVVDTVVPAFKDHPALGSWECANELPPLFAANGLTVANAVTVQNDLRGWIDAQDPGSLIISGCSTADSTTISGQSGQAPDAGLEWLRAAHVGWNTQSSHIYADRPTAVGTNGGRFGEWLDRVCVRAKGLGQPMTIGEFGGGAADAATSELQIRNMVRGFAESTHAQLGLIWNCDTSDFSGNQAPFIFNRSTRPYVLDLMRQNAAPFFDRRGAGESVAVKYAGV